MKLKTIKAVVAVLTIACTAAVADVTENFDGVSAQLIDPAGTVINGVTYKGSIANVPASDPAGENTYQTQVINPGSAGYIGMRCEQTTQGALALNANGNPTKATSNVIMEFPSAIDVTNIKVTLGTAEAYWRYAVQYTTDNTKWTNIVFTTAAYQSRTVTIDEAVNQADVSAIRFLVWRNGGSDTKEVTIDDIVITEGNIPTPVTGDPNDIATLELDQTSNASYLDTTVSGVQGSTDRTVSAWIKTTEANGTIISWGKGSAGNQMILVLEDGLIRLEAASGYRKLTTPTLNDGNWHHVAFTFTGITLDDAKFYVDGAENTTANSNNRGLNTLDLNKIRLGADVNTNRRFTGSMDEAAVFSRALSAFEIASINNFGNGRGYFHQIKNDAGDTNLVNDSNLIFYYDAAQKDGSANPLIVTDGTGSTVAATFVGDAYASGILTPVTGEPNDTATLDLTGGHLDSINTTLNPNGVSGVQGAGARTVSAWVKTSADGGIVSWGESANGKKMDFAISGGQLEVSATGGIRKEGSNLTDGAWHHVAFTFEGTTLNDVILYIDGVALAKTTSSTRAIATTDDKKIRLGVDVGSIRPLTGSMDEVAVFSRALTAGEILNICNEGNGRGYFQQIMNDNASTNLVNDANLIFYYDASQEDGNDNPLIVTDGIGTTVAGTFVGDIVTPALGVEVEQTGTEVTWSIDQELDVLEYQLVDVATGDVVATVVADGSGQYAEIIEEGVIVELIVIDKDGSEQTFIPTDGNVVTVEYNLTEGWNLIATTGNYADLSEVEAATVGTMWAWDGSKYVATDAQDAYQGIWVHATETKTVKATALKADSTFTLNAGWTLAGPANNVDAPEEATVFSWTTKYNEIIDKYNALIMGQGYWFFVTEETEVIVDSQ